jgi:ABC-type branched-subunit amino acid transport system ATPase component
LKINIFRQRIRGAHLGSALATQPKLLLLDEPLTGMNQNEIQTMLGLIRGIHESGITIVLIEHNIPAVMSYLTAWWFSTTVRRSLKDYRNKFRRTLE